MPRGKPVSKDLRVAVVRMAAFDVPHATISMYTLLSLRRVQEIVSNYCASEPAEPAEPSPPKKMRGRRAILTTEDVEVYFGVPLLVILTHSST
jgi:hypothetical protein